MVDGESSVLWSRDGERIRVKRSADSWVLLTECNEFGDEEPEWANAGVSLEALRDSWIKLALALRPHMTVAQQFMAVMVKPKKPRIDYTKAVKFARITGNGRWWVSWSVQGETQSGQPILSLEFSRALNADELVTMIGQMAKAFDDWDAEFGYG